jgi:hypothetical protein
MYVDTGIADMFSNLCENFMNRAGVVMNFVITMRPGSQ